MFLINSNFILAYPERFFYMEAEHAWFVCVGGLYKEFPELLEAAGTVHQSLPQLTIMNIEKTQCDQGQFNNGD